MSTQQQIQAARCYYLAHFVYDQTTWPCLNYYANTGAMVNFSNALIVLQGNILSGEIDPTLASIYLNGYVAQYAPVCGYYGVQSTFVRQLRLYTTVNGGDETIWNDIVALNGVPIQ